jgi:hypothetical protein
LFVSCLRSSRHRDIEGYLAPLDDMVKFVKFPDMIAEKSKSEVRVSYTNAFKSKGLGGQISIQGRMEMGDIYIIEQSLRDGDAEPIDQYLLFKFSGNKITEIHYLPKNFNWPKSGVLDK